MSYNGGITCGITADYDRAPDCGELAAGIEESLAELSALVPAPAKRGSARAKGKPKPK